MKKILVVGAGITGITLAQRLGEAGHRVVIVEKRSHIGGNCYDRTDEAGILVHEYGPHIFHTGNRAVWDYLSRFTAWIGYRHRVLSFVDGRLVPMPFDLDSLGMLFSPQEAAMLESKLKEHYGEGARVPILELRKDHDRRISSLVEFIYEKLFLHYTEKQWGLRPDQIENSVTARVPVVISRKGGYFDDEFQGMPRQGYSKMFEKMLSGKNIELVLNYRGQVVMPGYDAVFYTGPVDDFFGHKFGKLDYRCVRMEFKNLPQASYQPAAVVNYPNDHAYTRITEFKKLTVQEAISTTIGMEYPGNQGFEAWPRLDQDNAAKMAQYGREAAALGKDRIYFVGRLAEFKYYDMDDTVANALALSEPFIR
jgi:UDP-galactopyranose mutase